jgi:hypothetical protein
MNVKIITLLALIQLANLFMGCEEESLTISCSNAVTATVRDLRGLDGCGFVFELADGTKLEPQFIGFCGTPPLPKDVTENPLNNFQFVDGKQVKIGFEELPNAASICMVGKVVKITCIEEIEIPGCIQNRIRTFKNEPCKKSTSQCLAIYLSRKGSVFYTTILL